MNQKLIIEYWNMFINFFKDAIELGKEDMTVAGILLCIGALILLGLIWMIQAIFSRKNNKNRHVTPYDPDRVHKYNEDLSEVVGEGNVMIEMLENEIQNSQRQVDSLREEVDGLREERKTLQEEIRLMEESPSELADALKRENNQKLTQARKKGSRKALKMMFLGLFLGFLIAGTTSGIWVYKKHPDTVKAQFSDLQAYVTNLWQKK